jgi:hypothetical protein
VRLGASATPRDSQKSLALSEIRGKCELLYPFERRVRLPRAFVSPVVVPDRVATRLGAGARI